MEDNVFAAFSFSAAPQKGPRPGGAAHPSKVGNGSAFPARAARPRGPAASHATAVSRVVRGKVKHEDGVEGLGFGALDSDVLEDGGSPGNAPAIQTVAKIEKTETVEEEVEARALPQELCSIQVKGENQVKGEIGVNNKRPFHWNTGREEEIEDFGLSCRSAESDVLEVKKVVMKRQNVKLTKGSKCGSAEVRPPPPNWEEAIQTIRTMRTGRDAPVDLLGPAQLVDPNADSETQKFHVLVAAMISSQTRDAVTGAAMKRLHALPGGLTLEHLAESEFSTEKLEEVLKPVGFYRQKAKQLKSMAEILLKPPYCGSVPRTLDELDWNSCYRRCLLVEGSMWQINCAVQMKLPGVGPKVGLLVLWVGFGMGEVGLIVDTNVRRVCCRLGWAPEGSNAEQVRHELESWLPKDLWAEASFMFVGFGQQICKPIGPNCKECQLQNFCPSAFKCVKKVINKKIKS